MSVPLRHCGAHVSQSPVAVHLAQAVGVELNKKGAVKVDKYSHTNVDSIWAIGVSVQPLAIYP